MSPMTTLNLLIISNFVIGIAFLVVPVSAVWLWAHRHRDWPKSWVLLVCGVCMGSSGFSRIVHSFTYYHWPKMSTEPMALADMVTAIFAIIGAAVLPWGVWEIRKAPTPSEVEKLAAEASKTAIAEADAAWSKKEKERSEKRLEAIKAMMSDYSAMDPELKTRMLKIVEEI
jgi:hypothetical protein